MSSEKSPLFRLGKLFRGRDTSAKVRDIFLVATFVGMMAAEDAVNIPPVEVGRVREEGNLLASKGFASRDARDVNKGPLGPIVYNDSRRGGLTLGTRGDGDDESVVPFVTVERSV